MLILGTNQILIKKSLFVHFAIELVKRANIKHGLTIQKHIDRAIGVMEAAFFMWISQF